MKTPIIALAALAFASCASAYEPDPVRAEIQAYFNSAAEPTVKDSVWTQRGMFKVGVLDNKSDRSGYAAYVCEIVRERGLREPGIRVQVIDIARLVQKDEWKKLGEATCK